ncbi:hypothetical protein [Saccharibacillus sacchari]|uniref:Uncharacterized protein n=1 Tax=Saccharibacillus sacchari TaxID=456493 RepID=A0ACC6PFE8_9BACL
MQKLLGINKTTFSNLEYMHNAIFSVRYTETGKEHLNHTKGREINAKIIFHHYDGYLSCKEIFDGIHLIEYYYDWYAGNGQILQKFHAHYHPADTPEEIKEFDPWHWHVPLNLEDRDGHRVKGPENFTIHNVISEHILPYILRVRRSQI